MECINCNGKEFEERKALFNPTLDGDTFEVEALAMVCINCGSKLMNDKQMDAFRKETAKKLTNKNNLK